MTSCCSNNGFPEQDFFVNNLGALNLCAQNIRACKIVVPTVVGPPGVIGPAGIEGPIGPAGLTIIGPQGPIGSIGPSGIQGPVGPAGISGAIPSAVYAQLGAQPATVGAGQPFTFTTTIIASVNVTPTTAIFNPPFTTSGTVFQLGNIGVYEVNYQTIYPINGGVVLYTGPTVASMTPVSYSQIGHNTATQMQVFGSVLVQTTTTNSFLSINASPSNTSAIAVPPNSSTTNESSMTVSIKQIS